MTTTYNFDVSISSAVNANDETGATDRQETVVVRPLTPTTLGKIAALLAGRQLPHGGADLPARQPAVARATPT